MTNRSNGDRPTIRALHGADELTPRYLIPPPPAGPATMDIARLLAPMLRHRWLVLGTTVAFTLAAAAYVRWELPQYRATATIRLDDLRREVTIGIEAPEKASGPMTNPVVSEIQLLRSRELVGNVVDSLALRIRPDFRHFNASLLTDLRISDSVAPDTLRLRFEKDTVRVVTTRTTATAAYGRPLDLKGYGFTITARPAIEEATWLVITRERAIDAMLERLVVYPRVFSDVVDVSYTGYRPTVVRRVANGVVQGFVAAGIETATAAARKRRQFLETQMRQNDSLLSTADAELIAFRRHAKVFSTPARIDAQQREVLDVGQRLADLNASRRAYQSLLDGVSAVRAGKQRADALRSLASSPDLASNPAIATLIQQLLIHERLLDSLRTGPWRSAETDPDVQRTGALISANQENLLGLVKGYIGSIDARAEALDQVRARTTSSLVALPAIDAQDARLSRRVSTLANLGEYLRGEYQKARIAEGAAIGRAVVLDTASTPYQPVAQFRAGKIVVGGLVGLLLSILVATILERRNTSIRRREDLEASSYIPVLGIVPRLTIAPVAVARPPRRPGPLRGMIRESGSATPDRVDTARPVSGSVLDAYRMLRANVTRASGDGIPGSIVVTSAAPGDGKTTIAANLALAFAREGRRVLLIDCDLRRAAVHRMFRVKRSPGLAEILDSRAGLHSSIQPSGFEGLYVLTAGEAQTDSGGLLEGTAFRRTLDQLREGFDLLIIDSAPVLAVADAAVLSALVDGVLVVVRAGVTSREHATEVMRQLATAGAVVIGGVINDPAGQMVELRTPYYEEYAAR